jgi:hypothetical protein
MFGELVWNVFRQVYGWLWSTVFDAVFCALKRFVCWLIKTAVTWGRPYFDAALEMLPEQPPSGWEELAWAYGAVDSWAPLTEFGVVFVAMFNFAIALIIIRNIKKWIPTLAG